MDSFQELLRRLAAAHDREQAQLQQKLERSYSENAELQSKLDGLQNLIHPNIFNEASRGYQNNLASGEQATRGLTSNGVGPLPLLTPQTTSAGKAPSVVSSDSTVPGWRAAPSARSQSPPPRARRGQSPSPQSPAEPTKYVDWTQRSDSRSKKFRSSSPPRWCQHHSEVSCLHHQAAEAAELHAAADANASTTSRGREEVEVPEHAAGSRPSKKHWSHQPHGTPVMDQPALAPRSPSPTSRALTAATSEMKAPQSPRQGAVAKSTAQMPPTVAKMVESFREHVKQHGATGIAGIGRKFRICDDDHSGTLEHEELVKCFKELGFKFTSDETKQLIDHFDTDGDGKLDYEEFLSACRPPMSLRRRRLVQKVFERLDTDKSGTLTVDDIKANFVPHGDPRTQKGSSADKIAAEFLATFDVGDHDGNVTVDEFIKYYQGVSASIDADDYFELMIRNSWHMSGGKGWCENTSCLRVLVTHTDGAQEVVEIKNDLGLDKKNYQDLVKRLTKQGVANIKKVDLTG